MRTTSSKFLKIYLAVLLLIALAVLIIFLCVPKYKFLDNNVLEAPDGTLYHRTDDGYTVFKDYGKYLGRVRGHYGVADGSYKEGIYSADSSGSEDYVVFVRGYFTIPLFGSESFEIADNIFAKHGCVLNLCDMNKVTHVSLYFKDPGTADILGKVYRYTEFYLKDGYSASDVLNGLIGEEHTAHYDGDTNKYDGYIIYKIEGIDLFDIRCHVEYWEKAGWIITLPDKKQYRVNSELFEAFEVTESMEEFLENPIGGGDNEQM